MAYYITHSKLQGDIFNYRRLKAKNITQQHSTKIEEIKHKAENILDGYSKNNIAVRSSEQKIFAEYIDTFGFAKREQLLSQLQKESTFNVRQYLTEQYQSTWHKILHINSDKPQHLTARQMQQRIDAYKKLGKRLSRGWYHSDSLYLKQVRLEKEAENYAANFLKGKIRLYQNDVSTAIHYISVMGNFYDGSVANRAIEQLQITPIENFAQPQNKFATLWNKLKNKTKTIKNSISDVFSKYAGINTNSRLSFATKTAGLSFLLSAAAMFGFKSDKEASLPKITPTEIKANPSKTSNFATTKVLQQTQSFDMKNKQANEQKIWDNFYQTKNEIIASSLHLDANKLKLSIIKQVNKGIFDMPKNTTETQLVYTHLLYKAYGLKSPLKDIFTATDKISAQEQEAVNIAVATAGKNGLGVKKIAQQQAAKYGKKLSTHSAFDNAPKVQQQQFITDLKQIKELSR
ncbi:MAG: hypothetical protein IJ218_05850 [Alphaproteobacteria bacterium]|nr:hypothetical protein [Alphaproteobacteria bacterium]